MLVRVKVYLPTTDSCLFADPPASNRSDWNIGWVNFKWMSLIASEITCARKVFCMISISISYYWLTDFILIYKRKETMGSRKIYQSANSSKNYLHHNILHCPHYLLRRVILKYCGLKNVCSLNIWWNLFQKIWNQIEWMLMWDSNVSFHYRAKFRQFNLSEIHKSEIWMRIQIM